MELALLSLEYSFTESLTSFIRYRYQSIQSRGTQVQSRYQDTDEGKVGHIADLDEKIDSELSHLSFGVSYKIGQYNHKNNSDEIGATPLPISIGTSYYYPFQEREASFGPQIEFDFDPLTLGVSYHKGDNKVKTFSKGVYTAVPVYMFFKLPFIPSVQLGGGYSYHTNDIDPHVVSHLTTLGFPNTKEVLRSNWFGLLSCELNMPYSNNHVRYFLRYIYQKPQLHSYSENHDTTKTVNLSALQFGIKVRL